MRPPTPDYRRPLWTAPFTSWYWFSKSFSCCFSGSILASGGGTADRCIRIWNSSSGSLLNTVDTKSQVCSLVWAPEYKELVSAHGYANNEISIWKYPSMVSKRIINQFSPTLREFKMELMLPTNHLLFSVAPSYIQGKGKILSFYLQFSRYKKLVSLF